MRAWASALLAVLCVFAIGATALLSLLLTGRLVFELARAVHTLL